MNDRNLVRGIVLVAIALAFGLQSLRYPIGEISSAGPGLFPLMVSSLLLLIGLVTVLQSRFVERVALDFKLKNIVIITASLFGFAVISRLLNTTVAIAFLVFCAGFAGTSYSVSRNVKIAACLIAAAFAFQKLLGLNLGLY